MPPDASLVRPLEPFGRKTKRTPSLGNEERGPGRN